MPILPAAMTGSRDVGKKRCSELDGRWHLTYDARLAFLGQLLCVITDDGPADPKRGRTTQEMFIVLISMIDTSVEKEEQDTGATSTRLNFVSFKHVFAFLSTYCYQNEIKGYLQGYRDIRGRQLPT